MHADTSGADKSWVHASGPMRMRCVTWTRRGDAEPMDAFTPLAATFSNSGVLYVVIGAWGANYYAPSGGQHELDIRRQRAVRRFQIFRHVLNNAFCRVARVSGVQPSALRT